MKINFRIFAIAALFVAVSLVPALQAQTGTVVKVNVPFAFECGSTHFAPGTYTLNMLQIDTMLVRGEHKNGLAMTNPEQSIRGTKKGYAVFKKYGNRYFLEQIWLPGSATYIAVYEHPWEKQASEEMARNNIAPTSVELALLEPEIPTTR